MRSYSWAAKVIGARRFNPFLDFLPLETGVELQQKTPTKGQGFLQMGRNTYPRYGLRAFERDV